ncbi:MAG: AtpZ/AtpI family protein [Bacteroidales bacterium]|nr:AtpZ/AtpI family protein [Bacteroidales bacterium]MBQ7490634.1 AtpZ/AtpI family protein [Bacteroidales bacterium]
MKDEKSDAPLRGYAHYSGLAVQMAVIIALSTVGGLKLDGLTDLKPLFTVVCSLAGVALAMYVVIKDFTPKKNKNDKKN